MKFKHLANIFSLVFLLGTAGASAQTFVVRPGLNPMAFADNNLFKLQMIPGGQAAEPVKLEASLYLNGRKIATQTGISDPSTQSVQVLSGGLGEPFESLTRLGVLPAGSYTLCIAARGTAAQCQSFVVTPRSNAAHLRLTSPANGAELQVHYPILAWASSFQSIVPGATFRVVLIEKSELKREHFFENKALPAALDMDGLRETHLTYPVNAPTLEPGKEYVWGVEAYADGYLLAQSEVWSFHLKDPVDLNELPLSLSYIDITKINDLPSYYILGTLKLRYVPRLSAETASIRMLDKNNKEVRLKHPSLTFRSDSPYVVFNFEEEASLKHLEKYVVELRLATGMEKRFEITYVHPAFYTPEE